ncbi:MAG: hypothetical protein SGILL_010748 [Bacillariaceae sp.]
MLVLDSKISDPKVADQIAADLNRNRSSIRSICMKNDIFASDGFRSPTLKGLRKILECLPYLTQLEELELSGDLHLENHHDIKILCKAIQNHPSLKAFILRDFSIYSRQKLGSAPLLDLLVKVVSTTIPNLRAFQMTCRAIYWDQQQCLVSVPQLAPLCQSTTLQSLHLSGVRLGDEHLSCLVDGIAENQHSALTEVVLNRNVNTERGIHTLVQSLLAKESAMRRVEAFNGARASRENSRLVLQQLQGNHTIQHFRSNVRYEHRSEMDFLLLLNRCGRKVILDSASSSQEVLEVFSAAAKLENTSVLMYFLQANPSILERRETTDRPLIRVAPKETMEASNPPKDAIQQCWKTMSLLRSGWWNLKR